MSLEQARRALRIVRADALRGLPRAAATIGPAGPSGGWFVVRASLGIGVSPCPCVCVGIVRSSQEATAATPGASRAVIEANAPTCSLVPLGRNDSPSCRHQGRGLPRRKPSIVGSDARKRGPGYLQGRGHSAYEEPSPLHALCRWELSEGPRTHRPNTFRGEADSGQSASGSPQTAQRVRRTKQ